MHYNKNPAKSFRCCGRD